MTHEKAEYLGNNEEARRYFEGVQTIKEPVTSIKTPVFQHTFAATLTAIFKSHGIRIQVEIGCYIVTFPEGTYKTELLPRTHDEKYKIVLPDGFEILEVKRLFQEYSYIQIDIEQLSPEQQAALRIKKREKKE
jgi:hypothetical protein